MTQEISIGGHISKRFEHELEDIRTRVLNMGGLVEEQVRNGVEALVESNAALADQVATSDYKVNAMEVEIDETCVQILARRQPTAGDLRLVVAIIKTITDLERIGDQAEKLGRYGLELSDRGESANQFVDLEHLGDLVSKMLHDSLNAFARMSTEDAIKTMQLDKKINKEFDAISRQLITHMMEDPRMIKSALHLSWCVRALERIGDHSKNICEYVIFLVQGKDIRHTNLDNVEK